jgi:O-antigen/teichoic acid export membrane protein
MIGKLLSLGREFFEGRFGKGVFWNLIGTALGQGSVFVAAVIMARILGKEVFGEFGIVQSTLLTMTSIAQVATGITANKYVAEFRDTDKERTGRILGLCSVMTIATGVLAVAILLVGAPFLAEEVLGSPRLSLALSIGVVYVFFSVINGYQIGTLSGLEAYRSIAVFGAILGVGHVIVCVLGALYWGLYGALAGISLSAFLRWSIYRLVVYREIDKRGIQVRRREALVERDALFKFALPAALAGLTTMPALWLGNAFLVRQPGGFAEMGLYSAGLNLRTVILFVPLILNNVAVSLINSHKGKKDESSYQSFFTLNLRITFLLAFFGASAMWFFGEFALRM